MASKEARVRANKLYRERHPEKVKQWEINRGKRNRPEWSKANRKKNIGASLFHSSRQSARRTGRDFELTQAQVEEIVAPMICSVSGLSLSAEETRGPWRPSLDRIDNAVGYVPGNVRLTCWMFNRAKSHWTDEQMLMLAKGLVLHSGVPGA